MSSDYLFINYECDFVKIHWESVVFPLETSNYKENIRNQRGNFSLDKCIFMPYSVNRIFIHYL